MSRSSRTAAAAAAPAAAAMPTAAAPRQQRTTVKVESLEKFDPAVEGSFRIFHIRLRSVARAHGLGPAMDIPEAELKALLLKAPDASARTPDEAVFVEAATTLYLMLSVSISVALQELRPRFSVASV